MLCENAMYVCMHVLCAWRGAVCAYVSACVWVRVPVYVVIITIYHDGYDYDYYHLSSSTPTHHSEHSSPEAYPHTLKNNDKKRKNNAHPHAHRSKPPSRASDRQAPQVTTFREQTPGRKLKLNERLRVKTKKMELNALKAKTFVNDGATTEDQ